MSPRFYLASTSPRRYELLSLLNIPFSTLSINIPEIIGQSEAPKDYALRLAKEKSLAGLAQATLPVPVIGADTIGVINGVVLEKPKDEHHAETMLKMLSGKTHSVFTAVAVRTVDVLLAEIFETRVTFRELSEIEIKLYIQTGDAMDKAGSYGIQGAAGAFVTHIEGSYHSVMGLPTAQVRDMLAQFNVVINN